MRGEEHRLHGQLKLIAKQLRQQTKETELHFERLNQLRQSRLAIWVKQYGLRKAQYMAGYRLVETIEKYRKENPDGLKELVIKYHPLRWRFACCFIGAIPCSKPLWSFFLDEGRLAVKFVLCYCCSGALRPKKRLPFSFT